MNDPTPALRAELGRRTDVCWVRHGGTTQAVWHAWLDDDADGALLVVSGGEEQPFPSVPDGGLVEVVMRSKDTGGRLLTWTGRAHIVGPDDEAWQPATAALVARRLNLREPADAPARWADHSVVRRITPLLPSPPG